MPELLWLLAAVLLVMGLAYLFTKYIGRAVSVTSHRGGRVKMLNVVEQMYMGRDRQIVLVQAGERYFLLGSTATHISTLAEIPAEEIDAWREKDGQRGEDGQPMSFAQSLQEVLKRRGGRYNGD